jgi:hypothetical protein
LHKIVIVKKRVEKRKEFTIMGIPMMRKTSSLFLTSIILLLAVYLFVQNSDKNPPSFFLTRENQDTLTEVKTLLDRNLPPP